MRVSLVMTAWNAERFIADALRSVLEQTMPPDEIIVVDDGSVDGTAAMAEATGATVLRRAHEGIGPSRNAAIDASTGDVIALLDADDLWLPAKLERQRAVLGSAPGVGAVFCHVDEFLDRSGEGGPAVRAPKLDAAAPLVSSALLRRSVIDRLGPFEAMAAGDWVSWWAKARREGIVEHMVPEVLVRRRIHDDNNSARVGDGAARFLRIARAHRRAAAEGT